MSCKKDLRVEEQAMLQDYFDRTATPDEGDPFPELGLEIDQIGLMGPLLVCKEKNVVSTDLYMLNGKLMYKYCVKAINKKTVERENGDGVERDIKGTGEQ